MDRARLVELGTISRAHGFHGAFVVRTTTGRESALGYLKKVWLETTSEWLYHDVVEASWMPRGWKIVLNHLESDRDVKVLIGRAVYADREDLRETVDNQFYVSDLLGSEVIDIATQRCLGKLVGVETDPANQDRWWIEGARDLFAVPAQNHFIDKVDVASKRVWVKNTRELSI